MNIHKNAKLTPKSREILVERMQFFPVAQVAREMGVSTRTAYKWKNRYHQGGVAALMDASSRPHNCRNKLNKHQIEDICALRKERQTGYAIAQNLKFSVSIVYRTLKKHGLSNLKRLEAKAPVKRYEWPNPGDMLHMDIKKLGKIDGPGHWAIGRQKAKRKKPGWEYLHVCVDDHTRMAYTALMPDETKACATTFLHQACAWYKKHGINVQRILTDNGSCYKSYLFRDSCAALGITTKRTRPYRPQTNGKAERFIRSALNEWAYSRVYDNSSQRELCLQNWTDKYNFYRPHRALKNKTPTQRLREYCEQPGETLHLDCKLKHGKLHGCNNWHDATRKLPAVIQSQRGNGCDNNKLSQQVIQKTHPGKRYKDNQAVTFPIYINSCLRDIRADRHCL